MSNIKPLWLVCDFVPLLSNGDGLSSKSSRLIHLGSHFLTAQVISPLSSLKSQNLGGLSHISFSLEQLPSSTTPFLAPSCVASSNLSQLLIL
jgi:hypothetical protein